MRRLLALAVVTVACVPPDRGLDYGSVAFELGQRARERELTALHGEEISVERALLSFRTMTIGRIEVGGEDTCSFRGKGESSDILFDPRLGITQIFNGVKSVGCPDVGIALDPPNAHTKIGPGATVDDLVAMAGGSPAHALVDFRIVDPYLERSILVQLRFDTLATSSKFGGCSGRRRGIEIEAHERVSYPVHFEPVTLLSPRHAVTGPADVRYFFAADANGDGIVTMRELDDFRFDDFVYDPPSDYYRIPTGRFIDGIAPSLGVFLREQLKFAFAFDDVGRCYGNEPGFGEDE